MNEIIKALIQAGGAVGALGFVWLIVRALVPAFTKPHEKTNGYAVILERLDKEVTNLRKSNHYNSNCIANLAARMSIMDNKDLPERRD